MKSRGPTPKGIYKDIRPYFDQSDSAMYGTNWALSPKKCHNGSIQRRGMAIHSMGKRENLSVGDMRWETNGCVKLAPWDRRLMYDLWMKSYNRLKGDLGVKHGK